MADRTGYSKRETDWLGREKEVHYDNDGCKVGETRFTENWLGSPREEHFDTDGGKSGETRNGADWLGSERAEHFDKSGERIGWSKNEKNWAGEHIQRHFDTSHKELGRTTHEKDWLGQPRRDHAGRNPKAVSIDDAGHDARRRTSSGSGITSIPAENGSGSGFGVVALFVLSAIAYVALDTGKNPKATAFVSSHNDELPVQMPEEEKGAFRQWLQKNTNFRPAQIADCLCEEDLPYINKAYANQHPYYAAGDFNKDRYRDFAVIVIDKSTPEGASPPKNFNSSVVVFGRSPTSNKFEAFHLAVLGLPQSTLLFLSQESSDLAAGMWQGEVSPIVFAKTGYAYQ